MSAMYTKFHEFLSSTVYSAVIQLAASKGCQLTLQEIMQAVDNTVQLPPQQQQQQQQAPQQLNNGIMPFGVANQSRPFSSAPISNFAAPVPQGRKVANTTGKPCKGQFNSGPNKGQPCNRSAKNGDFCGIHTRKEDKAGGAVGGPPSQGGGMFAVPLTLGGNNQMMQNPMVQQQQAAPVRQNQHSLDVVPGTLEGKEWFIDKNDSLVYQKVEGLIVCFGIKEGEAIKRELSDDQVKRLVTINVKIDSSVKQLPAVNTSFAAPLQQQNTLFQNPQQQMNPQQLFTPIQSQQLFAPQQSTQQLFAPMQQSTQQLFAPQQQNAPLQFNTTPNILTGVSGAVSSPEDDEGDEEEGDDDDNGNE
jgi:hypothetical protein